MNLQVKKYSLFIIITILFINSSWAQTDTLFWFGVPYGSSSHTTQDANLTITATDLDDITHVMITQPYVPNPADPTTYIDTINITIDPGVSLTWDTLLAPASLLKVMNNTYVQSPVDPSPYLSNAALKIQSDRKITAYYEYNRTRNNPDIYSLKGTNAMGAEFWVPYQDDWYNHDYDAPQDLSFSQIIVVATEPNTVIDVDFQKEAYGMPPGNYTFTLAEPGQTLMFAPKADPTDGNEPSRHGADRLKGTHITSNEPITVTVGDCSVQKSGAYDMIGDQLVPTQNMFGDATIGYEYIVMKGEVGNTSGNEKVYVLTTQPNTTVDYQRKGGVSTNLMTNVAAGVQDEINLFDGVASDEYVYIVANNPVYVWHVSGFGNELGGAIIPTIDGCTGSLDVSFVRSKNQNYYLNIMTHGDALNDFEISQNGGPFVPFLTAADFESVGVSDFYVLSDASSLQNGLVVNQPIRLRNSTNVFHLGTVNGVTSGGGCAYGYFSDYIQNDGTVNIVASGSDIITECYGNEVELEASGGLSYLWSSASGSDIYLDNLTSDQPSAYLPVGIHTYSVNIQGPCGLNVDLPVSVEINENTESYFTLDEYIVCAPYTVEINNLTLNADTFLFDWEDDRNYDYFANNGSSTTIYHTYENQTSSDSVYTMKLFAYDKQKDCPDIYTKEIRVFPEINANFTVNTDIGCNPLTVNFTDNSSTFTSDNYKWTFGDGESYLTSVSPADVTHEFKHFDVTDTIDFEVKLVATSPYFCRDTAIDTISVFSYLEAGFTIDTAYGCSPFTVEITNNSAGEDSISLDYGDGLSLDGATFGTVSHTYVNTGTTVLEREIVLEVFNDEGCTQIWRDTVTIYPEIRANYNIDDPGNGSYVGCNSRTVAFSNTSNYGANEASSFLWTFGDGTNSNTNNVNVPHTYTNATNSDQIYTFNLHAESVYGCFDDTSDQITIYKALASFTIDADEGCSPLDVDITNTSKGTSVIYDWTYGNTDPNSALSNPPDPTYTNTTNAIVPYTLRLDLTHNTQAWCTTFYEEVIDVYPEISIDNIAVSSNNVCDSTNVIFTPTISDAGLPNVSYIWDFDDGTSSSQTAPTHLFRNIGNATFVDRVVSLNVETQEGCTDSTTTTVRVHPRVRAFFTLDESSGCSPDTIQVSPTSYPGISQYAWDFDGNTTTDATSATASQQSFVFPRNTSTTNTDNIYNVTLTVSNTNPACNKTFVRKDTVFAEAKADFDPQGDISCNEFTVTFDNKSTNVFDSQWDFKDGTTSSDFEPTHTFENTNPNGSKAYAVRLDVTTDNGCTHDTTANVSVYPYVKADFDIDVSKGCSPLLVNITNNSSVGATGSYAWYWDDTDNVVDSTINTSFNKEFLHSTGDSVVYKVKLVVDNGFGCKDSLTKEITVYSSLNAQFTFSQPDSCNESTVQFTNTTLYSSVYNWDFGDGTSAETTSPTISKKFKNTSNSDYPFTVTLTAESDHGCTSVATDVVTVYSYVEADFDIDVSEGCSPLTVPISNNSSGTSYYWFWDDNDLTLSNADSNSSNPGSTLYTLSSGGTRTDSLTLIIGNVHGCYDTLKKAVEVHSSIDAQFTFNQPDSCNKSDVEFTNATANASSFKWNFGDGTSLETANLVFTKQFTNTLTNDTTFTVTMTATSVDGCTDQATDNVTVYSRVIAGMSVPNSQACPPFSTAINNTSTGNSLNTYRWFVDGTEEFSSVGKADFNHIYDNTDPSIRTYSVRMEASNAHGCNDDTTATITVFEFVDAQFAIDDNDGCTGHTVTLDNQSVAPAASSNYLWNFGDATGSTDFEPSHPYVISSRTVDKTFRIRLTVTSENYCTDTISDTVRIYHQPLAKFNVSETSDCPPLETTLNNLDSRGFDSFEWRFGDGNTRLVNSNSGEVYPYSYPNTTDNVIDYKLKLWVGTDKGCTHIDSTTLNVWPAVLADFDIDDDAGCSAHVAEFMNASSSPATQFYWDFDDGSFENKDTVIHRFVNDAYTDRVFDVRLTATSDYNCWDDTVKQVTVYAQPKALFNPTPTVQLFPEATVWMNSTSNNKPWDYLWEFGDENNTTSTSSNLEFFEYDHWGEKDITLTLTSQTSSCSDAITKTIIIYPPEVNAEFETNIDDGCLDDGLEVEFNADASVYSEVYNYTWDFGDGSATVQGQDVTHTYTEAGVFHVKMTAVGEGGDDYEYKTIRVYPNPIADFIVVPNESMIDAVTLEARVEFYNQSICNDTTCSYIWDFGDGNTSFATNVTHYYEKPPNDEIPKEFDIKLVATNDYGCVDSLIKEKDVKILGEGEISFPNAFVPNSNIPDNQTFKPLYSGVIQYELLIYNRWGELIFQTNDLNVGWDGTVDGEPAKPDVYVWKAEGTFTNGRAFELAGDVTLIR